jgi:hypothetical protein
VTRHLLILLGLGLGVVNAAQGNGGWFEISQSLTAGLAIGLLWWLILPHRRRGGAPKVDRTA